MKNINIRKIGGIIVGIVIGFLPFINALANAIVFFVKKQVKPGLLLSLVFILQIVMLTISTGDVSTIRDEAQKFSSRLQPKLLEIKINSSQLINPTQLEDSVNNAFKAALINYKPVTIPAERYNRISTGTMSDKERTDFHDMLLKIHEVYFSAFNKLPGDKKESFAFNSLSYEERDKLASYTEDFTHSYLYKEFDERGNTLSTVATVLYFLTYILSFAISIFIFKDIFSGKKNTDEAKPATVTPTIPVTPDMPHYHEDVLDKITEPGNSHEETLTDTSVVDTADTIKINYAADSELIKLPGITNIDAINITNERKANGSYTDMNNFKSRISLSERIYNNIEKNLDFTIDENTGGNKGRVIDF